MYLEGVSFSAIARLLKVSDVSVLYWVRKAGQTLLKWQEKRMKQRKVRVMELDEMSHFIQKNASAVDLGGL